MCIRDRFYPVLMALRAWGETWFKSEEEEVAIHYTHVPCGKDPGLGPACQSCGAVMRRNELVPRLSDAFAEERKNMREIFKAVRA